MDYLSLCLSCKDEIEYLAEWLDYHILVGVERFYIYDNESQVSLRESLADYIKRGWVVVIDIPGRAMQLHAYDHCLQTFGLKTFWMGFIDTDEFLVPKTTTDIKELLKNYEAYGGLAVSSLFFGSNGHQARPSIGQIAAYTQRTHETFQGNVLIKSIVQPKCVLMPNSPHDFAFKEGSWCVNEDLLLVDGMKFPCHADNIQLNHYFCRSQDEVDQKISRGWADHAIGAWPRQRFDVVNQQSTYIDTTILEKLSEILQSAGMDVSRQLEHPEKADLLNKMAELAVQRKAAPIVSYLIRDADSSTRITTMADLKALTLEAEKRCEYQEAIRLIKLRLEIMPQKINLLVDLSTNYLHVGDVSTAWAAISEAWKIAPNSYHVLTGMAYFFLKVRNFEMAEKTCRLLIEMAPHNLMILGYLTEALIGLGRSEEAIKIGLPLVGLEDVLGELPKGMADYLIKLMANYLVGKKDYSGAIRLWEDRLGSQKNNVDVLIELSRIHLLAGDDAKARERLVEARILAPTDKEINLMMESIGN
jgi:tetratricopeptide (TPR) repeat protein